MKETRSANQTAKYQMIFAMVVFGTIGIFRKVLPFPSGMIAMVRGFVGMLFLLLWVSLKKKKWSKEIMKKYFPILCLSGGMIGINWMLLFEAYRYTSVSVATLCYYMAPILVILASPILFGEKLTKRKMLCVAAAFIGMVLVSGVVQAGFGGISEMKGVLFGLAAALFYAGVILLNKKIKEVPAYDRTILQLGAAGAVILPYTLLAEDLGAVTFAPLSVVVLLIVGILHTGVAYAMYFGSLSNLSAQTAALYSYLDPIVAIVLSALLLKEGMGIGEIIGALLILGAAFFSEKE